VVQFVDVRVLASKGHVATRTGPATEHVRSGRLTRSLADSDMSSQSGVGKEYWLSIILLSMII